MIDRVVIGADHIKQLERHATDSLPLESCALLLGKIKQNEIIVEKVLLSQNADRSTATFSIAPDELFKAYKEAEKLGLEVVAIFHSHPAPPRPSSTDARYMQINQIPWIIMSTTEKNRMNAFMHEQDIRQLDLSIS